MATFNRSDDLRGAEFTGTDLSGARFTAADLSGVVMRAVDVQGTEIDAPWLFDGDSFLHVNGVDVIPTCRWVASGRSRRRCGTW
jgi:hypothetical protein